MEREGGERGEGEGEWEEGEAEMIDFELLLKGDDSKVVEQQVNLFNIFSFSFFLLEFSLKFLRKK